MKLDNKRKLDMPCVCVLKNIQTVYQDSRAETYRAMERGDLPDIKQVAREWRDTHPYATEEELFEAVTTHAAQYAEYQMERAKAHPLYGKADPECPICSGSGVMINVTVETYSVSADEIKNAPNN